VGDLMAKPIKPPTPSDPLAPENLRALLAFLVEAQALALDVVRGRPIERLDVAVLREVVVIIRKVLDALDSTQPWYLPPDPPEPT